MPKKIQYAQSLKLPLVKGHVTTVGTINANQSTQLRQPTALTIPKVVYIKNESKLFITFVSKNSIYQDVPYEVKDADIYKDMTIQEGATVSTSRGNIVVSEICQVVEEGKSVNVVVRDISNRIYACPFLRK